MKFKDGLIFLVVVVGGGDCGERKGRLGGSNCHSCMCQNSEGMATFFPFTQEGQIAHPPPSRVELN